MSIEDNSPVEVEDNSPFEVEDLFEFWLGQLESPDGMVVEWGTKGGEIDGYKYGNLTGKVKLFEVRR